MAQLDHLGPLTPYMWLIPISISFFLTLFNLVFWPVAKKETKGLGTVDILIPARNEEDNIERCVRQALQNSQHVNKVIVCDDNSTDNTPTILKTLQAEFSNLKVIQGKSLPKGWAGKVFARHQLMLSAEAETILYIDCDVSLKKDAVSKLLYLLEDKYNCQALTGVPLQKMETWAEKLILPLLYTTYFSWLPIPLIWRSKDPKFMVAMGQIMLLKKSELLKAGGFEAIKNSIVDDMDLLTNIKKSGGKVLFTDASKVSTCRMYDSAKSVWEGFSKNIYEGVGRKTTALLGVLTLYYISFILPFLGLFFSWIGLIEKEVYLFPSLIGVFMNIFPRILMAIRFRQPLMSCIFHPLGVLFLLSIALNSWRWSKKKNIKWRGRSYNPIS
ncbi:MAG: hypothetical protein CME68_03270 [Halobacteriovoraceae bacterium]|nr:hypothetical protein [Halobacteriovoraceae bacterium]